MVPGSPTWTFVSPVPPIRSRYGLILTQDFPVPENFYRSPSLSSAKRSLHHRELRNYDT